MGGEKDSEESRWWALKGSPPHRRGKAGENHLVAQLPGITPAWAGKSSARELLLIVSRDHPRVGGEKDGTLGNQGFGFGSPPRGRGKAALVVCFDRRIRITPAWAGKRTKYQLPRGHFQDHPRVGGEKFGWLFYWPFSWGSPPRGRGKVLGFGLTLIFLGITPAWAGKSRTDKSRWKGA